MKVRAFWYAYPSVQEIEIPDDVTPEELDEYIRDHLELPDVNLESWDEVTT